ncbi:glutamine synthetase family protein [Asticcacaulis benevestitus]|uniref:Glutamine synthetase n=1 Tax=Asticcacaulis benevestitus DSM 16100 = ATCC BAA-896 TaxID=1121022 RepID=V4QRC7_9CAUL|nr:glutamine synthetase family protein [Asticcacaulis benevestitus]ESQ81733.1 glutamine synthetase [Asticcacaulis benevestitus DSM 16100 = ATCC BAA-896]
MTSSIQPRVAAVAEAEQFLAAHPHINYFEILFTSMSGVPRGKRLRRHELMPIYTYGRFLPGSILVADIQGDDCEATGLVWEDGDADRVARPVPGTLVPAPWLGDDVGQVMLSMYELDGTPNLLDPRHVLQGVLDRYAADGLTPVVACELEYYLVDIERDAAGRPVPATAFNTREVPKGTQVYGLPEIEAHGAFFRKLWEAADAQNIPLEGAISEFSPGQVELTLKHRADALRAADDAVLYKRLAKGVALSFGIEATFMAKPWADRAGSGFHVHISVADGAGNNLCASEAPEGAPLLHHMIGGMKDHLADCMAMLAPGGNSYKRFKANSYAPVGLTWGVNNRTVSLRVTAGPAYTRHVEHRVAGADGNPYLVLAAILACAHHGITRKTDPGPAVVGNGYAEAAETGATLPANWFAAVDRLERSDTLRDYLGDRFVDMYVKVKRTEQSRFFEEVTSLDYDWYLRNA